MNAKKIALVLAGIVVVALFFYFDLQRFLTLAALKVNRQSFRPGVASPRVLGSFALLGLFALIPVLYNKFRNREKRPL